MVNKLSLEDYIESVKESWRTHQTWLSECENDDDLGSAKKSHELRIKKRIEEIEKELKSFKVNLDKLQAPEDEDTSLLKELGSDSESSGNVDVSSDDASKDTNDYRKGSAKPITKMPTMEEKKAAIESRSSMVNTDYASKDPDELMKSRLKEYINAIEYLKKHNLSKDQKAIYNILDRAEKVKKLQKKYDKGNDVEIYEIPGEVTPEDLLGLSSSERIKKFQTLTTHVNKTMNELKLIGSSNFQIFNATKNHTAKDNYDRSIALFRKQAQLKKDLVGLAKNRWQPLPELQSVTEVFTDVKKTGEIDASVSEVQVKMKVPDDFQNLGKFYYKFKWMDGEDTIKKIRVNNKGEEVEAGYAVDFGHHKKFSNLKVVIKVKQWRCGIFDKTVNLFETNLTALKKGGTIKKNFKFMDQKFYVTIWMDMPVGQEENKNLEEIKVIDVAYTAPPFKSASGGAPEQPKSAGKKAAAPSKGGKKPAASEGTGDKKDVPIPEGIGQDEIKDPDVQRNLWSVLYCKKQSERYEKLVNAALKKQQPVNDVYRSKMLLFQSQVMGMESAIENEQVTFDQYMGYLKKGLEHDKILLKYFEDIGDEAKAKMVRSRIE